MGLFEQFSEKFKEYAAKGEDSGDKSESDEELQKAAEEAHENFRDDARTKTKGFHTSHAVGTGAAALFMLHKYNESRVEKGQPPISNMKKVLYTIIAMEAEHVGETQFEKIKDSRERKKHENEAREAAHKIARDENMDFGDVEKHHIHNDDY